MSEYREDDNRIEKPEERRSSERHDGGDPISNFAWAAILIWAGIVFLARNFGWFVVLPGEMGVWSIILIGAGLIILLEAVYRLLILHQGDRSRSSLFLAVALTGIGFGSIYGWSIVWPFILIAVGLSILLKNVFSRY
jgi:hypothetical protein